MTTDPDPVASAALIIHAQTGHDLELIATTHLAGKVRRHSGTPQLRHQAWRTARDLGASDQQIAAAYQVTPRAVRKAIGRSDL